MSEVVTIGDATLYHGDCLDILPTLPKVDAVITDPPYGIGAAWGRAENSWQTGCGKARLWGGVRDWDVTPSEEVMRHLVRGPAIIWGGNYMTGLPPSKGWMVWDKCADMTQAQAELAWSNVVPNVRVFKKSPIGVWGNFGANGEVKHHPTQKPVALMSWCVEATTGSVIDPYMGVGTTGVACVNLGRKFVGIEIERKYFDIACERIDNAYRQERMFA